VAFNLSDSGAFALCAVAPSGHLGVDIEIRRRIEDADALVRRYFTIREIAEYLRADAPARLEAFFTLWTRKEALLKATGEGLRRPLDSVDAGNAIDLNAPVRLPDAAGVERCWSVRSFTPSPGYSGAVAYDGDLSGLEFFDWSDAAGETLLDRPRLVVGGDAWR
jgi:4'-phosphopantetheinyl transferase